VAGGKGRYSDSKQSGEQQVDLGERGISDFDTGRAFCRKVRSESKVAQSCPTLSDPMDCSLPGCSTHRIFQARVLEWGAIAFSVNYLYKIQIQVFPSWPEAFAVELYGGKRIQLVRNTWSTSTGS
ncbi:hypothetical protein MG293_000722, partial [Ovis ammon polii]